jgi:hypothetical protein
VLYLVPRVRTLVKGPCDVGGGVTNTTIPSAPASSYCLITSGSAATGAATTTIDRGLRQNSRANLSSIARPSRIAEVEWLKKLPMTEATTSRMTAIYLAMRALEPPIVIEWRPRRATSWFHGYRVL